MFVHRHNCSCVRLQQSLVCDVQQLRPPTWGTQTSPGQLRLCLLCRPQTAQTLQLSLCTPVLCQPVSSKLPELSWLPTQHRGASAQRPQPTNQQTRAKCKLLPKLLRAALSRLNPTATGSPTRMPRLVLPVCTATAAMGGAAAHCMRASPREQVPAFTPPFSTSPPELKAFFGQQTGPILLHLFLVLPLSFTSVYCTEARSAAVNSRVPSEKLAEAPNLPPAPFAGARAAAAAAGLAAEDAPLPLEAGAAAPTCCCLALQAAIQARASATLGGTSELAAAVTTRRREGCAARELTGAQADGALRSDRVLAMVFWKL